MTTYTAKLIEGSNYGSQATTSAWSDTKFMKDLETNLGDSGLSAKDQVTLAGVVGAHIPSTGIESLSCYDTVTASSKAWGASGGLTDS